jgi:hypothetical protein
MALDDFVTEANETELDLGVDLETVPAQHAVPGGEYQLCLVNAEIKQQKPEKGDGKFIQAQLEIVGDPNSKLIKHIMMLPNASDDDRKKNARLRNIGDFYKAFGIPSVGKVNLASYFGNFGWAILTVEDGNEYGEQNRVKRFITGK